MPYYKSGSKYFTAGNKLFSTSWKPSDITGMIFWGKNEKRYVIEDESNNTISKWKDNSGFINDAIQETEISQPYYINNYEGAPALYFTGGFLKIPLTINYFTIFTVIKSSSSNIVYEFGDSTIDNTGFYLNGDRNSIAVSNSGFSNLASVKDNGDDWIVGGWKILAHQYNGNHATHRLYDGRILQSTNTYFGYSDNPGAINLSENLNLGAKSDGTNATNSYIREFIVYNRYLSVNEINQITVHLASKHGLPLAAIVPPPETAGPDPIENP